MALRCLSLKLFVINKRTQKAAFKEWYVYPINDEAKDFSPNQILESILQIEKVGKKTKFFSAVIDNVYVHHENHIISEKINMDTAEKICNIVWKINKESIPYV